MTSTLFLNKRQTLLINKFQLNTFSKPAHVLLHIGDYVYIHLRTTLPSQHTESGFQVKPVTLDTADHDFGCCKPMRDALVPRLGSFSDDTILCSTNLEQSGISSSCYVATGDERELPEMIEYGVGTGSLPSWSIRAQGASSSLYFYALLPSIGTTGAHPTIRCQQSTGCAPG
jgi:hypothetical protein